MVYLDADRPRAVAGAFGRVNPASDFEQVLNEVDSLTERYESADRAHDYGVAELYLDLLRSAVERRDSMMYA